MVDNLADKLSPETLEVLKGALYLSKSEKQELGATMEKQGVESVLEAAKIGDKDAIVTQGLASLNQFTQSVIHAATGELAGNQIREFPIRQEFLKSVETLAGQNGVDAYNNVVRTEKDYIQAKMGGDDDAIASSVQKVSAAAKQFSQTVQAGFLNAAAKDGAITMSEALAVSAPAIPATAMANKGQER